MDIVRPDRSRQKKLRKGLTWLAVVVMAASVFTFVTLKKPGPVAVERERLWIGSVSQGMMLRQVRGAGTLVPADIRWVAARTSGRIERIMVLPGAKVSADTVIMELSNPDLVQETQAAQLELNSREADFVSMKVGLDSRLLDIEASIHQLEAEHEQAELEAAINKELFQEGLESELSMKRAELGAAQLKNRLLLEQKRLEFTRKANESQLSAEQSRIEQTRAHYALLQERLDGLSVKAGFEGVLQRQSVEEGQQVGPGQNLSQVADPKSLKAVVRISEHQAKDIMIGQAAKIDTRNGIVDGEVIRVDPNVQEGTVAVDVKLLNPNIKGIRPDLTVEGIIDVERIDSTIYANRPVFARPDSDGMIFRFLADTDIAERIPVHYGRASADTIEITRGVAPGDRIILSDTSDWDDRDQIRVF